MEKTLVTGGYGLVGSEFNGPNYIPLSSSECDLRDRSEIDSVLEKIKFDSIIHCAARVGGVGGNMNYKGEFFHDNIMMNTNIIESARVHGIKNLVAFLSTCVFPNNIDYPLTENKIHLGPPHSSNDAYAYSKRMTDIQIRAYREQYGLNYKSVIPTNIYGPNDNYNLENGHVIPSLIHKCYLAKINNTPFEIWGNGDSLREFIFSKDIAKLTEWVLNEYNEPEPIILSTSQEVSIKEVVSIITEIMEFEGKVYFNVNKPNGQYRKPSDNSKLKSYLPNFEFTSLYDGLKITIDYFIKNYKHVRK